MAESGYKLPEGYKLRKLELSDYYNGKGRHINFTSTLLRRIL